MPIEILMPALSPTMEEGTLAKWLVKEGDEVRSGDVIAEIETDKATMEVEAVDEGVVGRILVEAGAEGVKVNAPIALLLEDGEDKSALSDPSAKAQAAPQAASPPPASASRDTGEAARPAVANGADRRRPAQGDARIKASPLAKRLAAQAGLDIATIAGTGPHGRIVKRDIEAAKAAGGANRALPAPPAGQPAQTPPQQSLSVPSPSSPSVRDPRQMGIEEGSYDLVKLDGMRKTIARRMTESFRDVPHFPLTIDVSLDALMAQRKRLNERVAEDGVKISVNDFLIRASALALKKVPESNASYSPDGILMHHHADVAVAVAIEGGLITPIVRKAETKGLAAISLEMKELAARARDRKLKPEEYSGGTFSLSNLGMFGIKTFASILNEPHGMIMSVGSGEPRPVVKDGVLGVSTLMTVTLTCDHRVVDGAIGASFLKVFKNYVEDPEMMLI